MIRARCITAAVLLCAAAMAFAADADELSAAPAPAPEEPVPLLFIHHSCGGQLLAEPGDRVDAPGMGRGACIHESHPNGGGLRRSLEAAGFQVNEASYGSVVGQDTDIHDWPAKFRDHMDRILRTRMQDEMLPEGTTNRVVAFKSCYPNNLFVGEGEEPGDAEAPELTVANARAAYRALLPHFAEHPDVLFVAFTAPPHAQPTGVRAFVGGILGRRDRPARLAVGFNDWLTDAQGGWLAGYEAGNVVVFDHFGVLADARSGWSAYPTGGGGDSHPSSEGNTKAAAEFVPFVRAALDRMAAR